MDGNEIDLLIKRSGILYPIEIKKHVNCDKGDIAAFKYALYMGFKRRYNGFGTMKDSNI